MEEETICTRIFELGGVRFVSDSDGDVFEFIEEKPDDQISLTYKRDPTIQHYLSLRAEHPEKVIEVAATGGIDWLFKNEEMLAQFGLDGDLIASCLDADCEAQSKLSLQLLALLAQREAMIASGETHVSSRGMAISDKVINYLIALMLDAQSWTSNLELPRDLIVLIRYQMFGGSDSALDRALRSEELKQNVSHVAAAALERGEPISKRAIAKQLKINVSTVSRMFPNNELKQSAAKFLDGLRAIRNSQTPFADMAAEQIRKMEE